MKYALVTLLALGLMACGGAPATLPTPTPTPAPSPTPSPTPPSAPTCTVYPSSTPCSPGGLNSTEQDLIRFVNEMRTQGTLDGDPAPLKQSTNGCYTSQYAGVGGLPALTPEGHLDLAARMHSMYQATNHLQSKGENPALPDYYADTAYNRALKAGVPSANATSDEDVYAQQLSGDPATQPLAKTIILKWLATDSPTCGLLFGTRAGHLGMGVTVQPFTLPDGSPAFWLGATFDFRYQVN